MNDSLGVFICQCGTNIADLIDLDALTLVAKNLPDVEVVQTKSLLCSQAGLADLEESIRQSGVARVVVAACSPKEHEQTFRRVCARAGVNPYLYQLANIRELSAWVTEDKEAATQKAIKYLKAAVNRVRFHEPLETRQIECSERVLVIGGGVAGLEAALTLAEHGRKVTLVERAPNIGGKPMKYEKVFPTRECSTCMLEHKMDQVLHNQNIEVLSTSELVQVRGFHGNFMVDVKSHPRSVSLEACIGCGLCYQVCPVSVPNEFEEGMSTRTAIHIPYFGALPNVPVIDREHCLHYSNTEEDCTACRDACPFGAIEYEQEEQLIEIEAGAIVVATGFQTFDAQACERLGLGRLEEVYTSLQLERLLSSNGPTKGELIKKDGSPANSLVILQCIGREQLGYCSAVCCMSSIELALQALEKKPEMLVTLVHEDWCLPGKGCDLQRRRLSAAGGRFHHVHRSRALRVEQNDGNLMVSARWSPGQGIEADMVVLATGLAPASSNPKLAEILNVALDDSGFFAEEHRCVEPVASSLDGIYIAGTALGPMNITSTSTSGAAAAGKVMSHLRAGEPMELDPTVAVVDPEACAGCRICQSACPYGAISRDESAKVAVVNDVLCRGCGTCTGACPAAAITSRHFTTEQLFAEIEGVLR